MSATVSVANLLPADPLKAAPLAVASEPVAGAPAAVAPPVLDAERLVVYDVALELQVMCCTLVPVNHRVLQDQLERASLSVVCNIAEGAGRRSRKDKRRVYAMARGSAAETAAIIDVLRLRHLAPEGQCRAARSLALRVVQLLTKLDKALA
jgi:four helix bundle protein